MIDIKRGWDDEKEWEKKRGCAWERKKQNEQRDEQRERQSGLSREDKRESRKQQKGVERERERGGMSVRGDKKHV